MVYPMFTSFHSTSFGDPYSVVIKHVPESRGSKEEILYVTVVENIETCTPQYHELFTRHVYIPNNT